MTESNPDIVSLNIDGLAVKVPKGTNLIEAAASIGIEIPHFCYHPQLCIAGSCRMCQVKIKGFPKLEIACNTQVKEGMEVFTHKTSKEVAEAQAATLEFILINHPLDCTVCDQAGHCKLQDYYYQYDSKVSRFPQADKEHKVKALPLGPNIMLDGERCILCSRCIRFCDEITQTSELGMLNRGDRSVISIFPERELNNPLSGTVADLCPVGALTHKPWRFNTRIWFTNLNKGICPGCSTGCNVEVAERDGAIVHVKARPNRAVNKEWLCDEGRYGFHRFLPEQRLTTPLINGQASGLEETLKALRGWPAEDLLIVAAPDLMLEEYRLLKLFLDKSFRNYTVALSVRSRGLSPVESLLISPDYAANYRGAEFAGLVYGDLEAGYYQALKKLKDGQYQAAFLVGDRALDKPGMETVLDGLSRVEYSAATVADGNSPLVERCKLVFPGRSVLEKSGLLINQQGRLQYTSRFVDAPRGAESEWQIIRNWAKVFGHEITTARTERELTMELLASDERLKGVKFRDIQKGLGPTLV